MSACVQHITQVLTVRHTPTLVLIIRVLTELLAQSSEIATPVPVFQATQAPIATYVS